MSPRRSRQSRGRSALAVAMSVLAAALAGAPPALGATPAPRWTLESHSSPTNLEPGGEGEIIATAANLGDAEVNGHASEITITDTLPAGLEATRVEASNEEGGSGRTSKRCTAPSVRPIVCTYAGKVPAYYEFAVFIHVKVNLASGAEAVNTVAVSGGETASGEPVADPEALKRGLTVSSTPTQFGVERYELTPENENGSLDTEAGSHPFQLTTTFDLNETRNEGAPQLPALPRNLSFQLPPGLVGNANVLGNPNAVGQCSGAQFGQLVPLEFRDECPADAAVGVAAVFVNPKTTIPGPKTFLVPVFNLTPPPGEPAQFGFYVDKVPVVLNTSVRSGGDYGVTVSIKNEPQTVDLLTSRVTFWGVPTDAAHNESRGWACLLHEAGAGVCEEHFHVPDPAPLLTLPTSCTGLPASSVSGQLWPNESGEAPEFGPGTKNEEHTTYAFPSKLTGCPLGFEPAIGVEVESKDANTPTGLTVHVHMPWESEGRSEAAVKETKLEFEGLLLNPSAANGLQACPEGEAGVGFTGNRLLDEELEPTSTFTETLPEPLEPGTNFCPNASKVGVVHISTPDLPNELEGGVYLAEQNENPFGSLFAMYIVAQEPASKVLVKLAGEVAVTPTGQITTTFKNTPDVPFENLTVELFGDSPRASLTTPPTCGSYNSKAAMVSWSGSTAERSSSYQITRGAEGPECPNPQPFAPSFSAGSTNSQAGAFTPFTLTIKVPQADSALRTISNLQLPPGLAAVIASVTPCPEPWAEKGTCGVHDPESEIGVSTAVSGLGEEPYSLPGTVYLTGPYDGAPFGLSAVTAAKAGPFDLGTVVVRSSIAINESTAAATINTEAARFISYDGTVTKLTGFPEFVEGVPAQIKQLNVTVQRSGFEFNPTNCSPMSITATLKGAQGGEKAVSSPFYATNCAALPFEPKLTASVVGQGSKAEGTTFSVKIESPGLGQANIHKVDLTIPASLPSRLSTLQKACLEAVFNANPASCDEGSVIGEGTVRTPVFKNPLKGPAYLVSHGGAEFPDVEFVLKGEQGEAGVKIVVDGKTDIKDGVTYSKFETAPDAPFTSFETTFPAGPHSVLTPSVPEAEDFNLCKTSLTLPTEITAQDGAFISETTPVEVTGCKGVLPSKVTKLTNAQLLAKALKACKKDRKKRKRVTCEQAARKKYGAKASKHTKKK